MALFLFAGDAKSSAAKFFEQFSANYLKMSMQVLDASTYASLLSKMNEKTIIFISNGFTLGANQGKLVDAIKEKNVTLLFKDHKEADMKGYVAVAAEAPYVVVHNVVKGRKQQIVVIDDAPTEAKVSVEEIDIPEDDSSQKGAKQPAAASIKKSEPVPISVRSTDQDDVLKMVADVLKDDLFYKTHLDDQVHYWQHDSLLVLTTIDTETQYPPNSEYPDWLNGSKVIAYYALSISMFAVKSPTKKKYITFQQTDACGMNVRMKEDHNAKRGHFNEFGDTYICYGWVSNPDDSQFLPTGWIRPHIEPHTPNSQTTYTSTTGWGVSVVGGGDPSGPSANVTASYNQSDQVTKTIYDFSVRNRSTNAMSAWNFYYTAMDGNGWGNHNHYKPGWGYAINDIADLGKSTMHLNTEAVYEGPENYSRSMNFRVFFKPRVTLLQSAGSVFHKRIFKYSLTYTVIGSTTLYLDKVSHPK